MKTDVVKFSIVDNNQPLTEYSNMTASSQSNGIAPTQSLIL